MGFAGSGLAGGVVEFHGVKIVGSVAAFNNAVWWRPVCSGATKLSGSQA
jgi:hypothetical protein